MRKLLLTFVLINLIILTGCTSLYEAVKKNDVKTVREIAGKAKDKDKIGGKGLAPIHLAATMNSNEVLQALIDGGVYVNTKSRDSETALMITAKRGNLPGTVILLDAKADIFLTDGVGLNAFMKAVLEKRTGVVEEFVKRGDINLYNSKDNNGKTALMYLAEYGYGKEVSESIKKIENFDFEYKDKLGNTLLNYALKGLDLNAVKSIFGSDIDFTLQSTKKNNFEESVLFFASRNSDIAVLKYIEEKGINLNEYANIKNTNGQRIIEAAAEANRADIVDYLLTKGFDANYTNDKKNGERLTYYAILNGNSEMLKNILKNNGDANANPATGIEIMELGLKTGKGEVVATLIDNGYTLKNDKVHLDILAANENIPTAVEYFILNANIGQYKDKYIRARLHALRAAHYEIKKGSMDAARSEANTAIKLYREELGSVNGTLALLKLKDVGASTYATVKTENNKSKAQEKANATGQNQTYTAYTYNKSEEDTNKEEEYRAKKADLERRIQSLKMKYSL